MNIDKRETSQEPEGGRTVPNTTHESDRGLVQKSVSCRMRKSLTKHFSFPLELGLRKEEEVVLPLWIQEPRAG